MSKKPIRILLLIIIFVGVVALAGYFSWKRQRATNQSLPPPTPTAAQAQLSWQSVNPGQTFNDLIKQKGEPKQSDLTRGTGTVNYAGTNQYWDTAVSVQNDTIYFIREHVFKPQNTSLQSRLSLLDKPPTKLYGRVSSSGQYLYVSTEEGVAFLANEQNDTVYEVWYFKPAPLATILTLPALSGYSTDLNTVRGEGGH